MTQKKKRPTLQDIADKVGVTKMTVSRYLRDPSLVSESLQSRLAAAVEELGYIPNRAPEILSNAKSKAIGVLLPSLTNQVFAEVIRGIESVTEPAGYQLMMAHYGYSESVEEERIAMLLSYNVDALILSESWHTERVRRMLSVAGVPVVEIMDSESQPIEQAIGFNNVAASKAMTERMLEKGYRHIVYLAARMDRRTQQKLQGYEQAMAEANISPMSIQTERASSFSLGGELLQEARKNFPNVDAVICTNDDLAIGVLFECQRQNISVPKELGVVGFHGHNFAQVVVPRLATVVTPREQMGTLAAEALLARLAGEPVSHSRIELPVTLDDGETL